ncbi:MAG TPA: hypothetical protein VFC74_04030, partial [Oscillospiraceae bacterium]|nr:hypothetical protein [Oscillospiraceae bacterium]
MFDNGLFVGALLVEINNKKSLPPPVAYYFLPIIKHGLKNKLPVPLWSVAKSGAETSEARSVC